MGELRGLHGPGELAARERRPVEFNVVPAGERLTAPFEIADGVVIPPGTYHWTRYRLEGGTASKRKLSGQGDLVVRRLLRRQARSDRAQRQLDTVAALHVPAERRAQHRSAGRRATSTQTVVGTKVRLNFSPDLQLNSYLQYDNEKRTFGTNTRLRWTFYPLGDLFVIYNHNLREIEDRWRRDSNELLVKAQYTFRW